MPEMFQMRDPCLPLSTGEYLPNSAKQIRADSRNLRELLLWEGALYEVSLESSEQASFRDLAITFASF